MYLDLVREHEGDEDTDFNCRSWNGPQKFGNGTRRVGNRGRHHDYQNYNIAEIG